MAGTSTSTTLTGIPRMALYRLSLPFCERALAARPGLHGLRLLHVLTHTVCRSVEHWHGTEEVQPDTGYTEQCTLLRERLGLSRSNDNDALAAGLEALQEAGVLQWYELRHDNHWLAWRLHDDLFEILFADTAYGLFDLRPLPDLTTPIAHVLYMSLGLIRRMRRPELTFNLGTLGEVSGRSGEWSRLRPAMVDGLQRTAKFFDAKFLVALECNGSKRGIDTAVVRMKHDDTLWHRAPMTTLESRTRKVLLVDATRCVEVSPKDTPSAADSFFWPDQNG